jgi:hypothetical protein
VSSFTCDAAAQCGIFAGAHRVIVGDAGGRVYFLLLESAEEDTAIAPPR